MTIYFTSDHHFGHANIIKYCDRPFDNVDHMDSEMIRRWNEVVQPNNTVYHLGDFTLEDKTFAQKYFAQLNGIINTLSNPWHHDKRWLPFGGYPVYRSKSGFGNVKVLGCMDVREYRINKSENPLIVLCHYPLAEWDRKHYGAWHLHGHSHGKFIPGSGVAMLDVGVDSHDFYPISLEQVTELISKNLGRS
jgi:calcineurin-like phosphoesterase family protein